MKQKLLLVAAVFFGLLAFVLTYQQIEAERARAIGSAELKRLIVLKRSLNSGDIIKETDLGMQEERRFRSQNIPEIPWEQRNSVIGRNLDVSLPEGRILMWNDLKQASSRKEGLTSIIPEGYRAIAIPVDAISSVAGLVRPDNNVDIIGTFHFPDMKGDQALDTVTLTILQNVKVLATGTETVKSIEPVDRRSGPRRSYGSVTLCLKPKEVEMIIFASQKGKLTLSLRNYEETKVETDIQSVNFNYLQKNLQKYNKERACQLNYIE